MGISHIALFLMLAMKKKWGAVMAIVLVVSLPITMKIIQGEKPKAVEIEKVALRTLTPTILASGSLAYESQVTLVSEVVGRVQEVLVKEGDQVKKGQLLLRLDPESLLAEVAQLESSKRQSQLNVKKQSVNLESQTAKQERYKSLHAQGFVDASKYNDFITQKELAEIDLRTSREAVRQVDAQLIQTKGRLAKTEIRSPINGKVTTISIKEGETAVPSANSIAGSTLMVIGDTSSLYAEINIDETDLAKINIGQKATIIPAAYPNTSLLGKVEHIAIAPKQNLGQSSKSYPVKIQLKATPGITFYPGMSCRAEILTTKIGSENSLAVPVQAVRYEDAEKKLEKSKANVLMFEAGKAVKYDVELGVADDTYIEILSGLKQGQNVIIGPAKTLRFLHDGEPVVTSAPPVPAIGSTPKPAASNSAVNP